jgi:DNA mismatch repair protein MutS
MKLENCRHPVVEQFTGSSFVPNTVHLGLSECLLLTGPNMAGKSTLMRQVALNVLLAQMGSYIPALSATLPIYDAVYTRIGASDQLSEGLSTFMVEMTETAHMLKSATPNSLLILDEVGRGTATFDGMCLAQAILEYSLQHHKNHMLFATHYHELTALQNTSPQIKNAHMKVIDHGTGRIEFLHVLMPGPAGKSYGVQVAELAGVPSEVTKRAEQLLKLHEGQAPRVHTEAKVLPVTQNQMSLFEKDEELKKQKLIEDVKKFSVQKSSPLQALNQIAEWQDNLN